MARKRRSKDQPKEIDAIVERLREFVRLNYMTAGEVARQIGVNDSTVYRGFWVKPDQQNLSRSRPFYILYRQRTDPASLRLDMNIVNTRTGAGFRSRAAARFARRRRGKFEEAVAGF